MPIVYYPAIVEAGDEPGFGVVFPDLGGCTSAGATVQDAARNAEDALRGHLTLMIEDGDPLPPPRELDAIAPDPDVREVARLLVRAELPGRAVRLNISLEESLVAAIDHAATERGMTRSGFLAEAARRFIAAGDAA